MIKNFENNFSNFSFESSNNEKKEIVESALEFTKYLINRWPQVEEWQENKKRINYYLCGSLALLLLSRADKIIEIDERQVPLLFESRTREIPQSARNFLISLARPIGDIDYVPLDHYKANPKRLKKGGGPFFSELPEKGRNIFKETEDQIKIMFDPLEAYGPKKIAKITIGDYDFYIARPDSIFAYKFLHLLQKYELKPERFNADFEKILSALEQIYTQEELIQTIVEVLENYEDSMRSLHNIFYEGKENPPKYEKKVPKYITGLLVNSKISPEIKRILERLKKSFLKI